MKNELTKKFAFLLLPVLATTGMFAQALPVTANRAVFVDTTGIVRWKDNRQQVALFGANYCLPSACDYRAAGYVTSDRKKVIDQDMAHFARMGFDALRLCLWGDFENSDHQGNLIQNDHLDLLDYLIARARERGIYMLLSPIVTYSSQWPDAMDDTAGLEGFSTFYKKSELGTNPQAIAAQANYLKQLLNHVNPYTGVSLKDEPAIIFLELINEPTHHSSDVPGSIRYINSLVDAVRSTGCRKILFFNVSQDFNIAKAMQQSKIQGATFAWYPSGLNSGATLKGNYLPVVDEYSPEMLRPELAKMPRIVYEFDSPDLLTGYMYPAMARSFRRVGCQWASMFSYDMMATAPYNLGWQTHFLNLVYTPIKAASAIIAGEVMHSIPLYKDFGKYPQNTHFGDFRLSYDSNLAILSTPEKFLYTNTTQTGPIDPKRLQKVVGYGSSPVVQYDGRGLYFLDKIKSGVWRLEVYPDALIVADPFQMPSPGKIVVRSIHGDHPMTIVLPDLGTSFQITGLDSGNVYHYTAERGKFNIEPGVYVLSADPSFQQTSLPHAIGAVRMRQFVEPADQQLPIQVRLIGGSTYETGRPMTVTAQIADTAAPDSVALFVKGTGARFFQSVHMTQHSAYTYEGAIPTLRAAPGPIEYCIVVWQKGQATNFPSGVHISPRDWDYYPVDDFRGTAVVPKLPLTLLDPGQDVNRLHFTRIGDNIRTGVFKVVADSMTGAPILRLALPVSYDHNLDDYTVSLTVVDKLKDCRDMLPAAADIVLDVRGISQKQEAWITLVEKDGTCWSKRIELSEDWRHVRIPLGDLTLGKGAMLPLGYPGRWDYWFTAAADRGGPADHVRIADVQMIQLSMRQAAGPPPAANKDSYIEVRRVALDFQH